MPRTWKAGPSSIRISSSDRAVTMIRRPERRVGSIEQSIR